MKTRTCKLCPMPVEGMKWHCAEHEYENEQKRRERDRERKRTARREEGLKKPGRKPEAAPTRYAERLKDTPEDVKASAYQELRHLVRCVADAPGEGTAAQAAYRRMMERTAAIGGVA